MYSSATRSIRTPAVLGAVTALASIALVSLTSSPADASVAKTYCDGKAHTAVVESYTRASGSYPLRCGSASWGFRHITARWSATFDSKIALTISRGEKAKDVQGDGGTAIFALFDNNVDCDELFRVIYNGGALNGDGVKPQGMITAYDKSVVSTVAPTSSGAADATPEYGTTCGVDQNI